MSWIDFFLVLFAWGVGVVVGIHLHKLATEHPFKWACDVEDCGFFISGNHMETIDRLMVGHQDAHMESYRQHYGY